MDELESVSTQGAAELEDVRRQLRELTQEQEPAPAAVGRRPDVREAGDRPRVDVCAGLAEEVCGRPGRAVDVRLELRLVELPDEVRERRGSPAELRAVVNQEDRGARGRCHDAMLV